LWNLRDARFCQGELFGGRWESDCHSGTIIVFETAMAIGGVAALSMFTRKYPSTLWQEVWFMRAVPSYKNPFYFSSERGLRLLLRI
jgi:hypothetical protein